MASLSSVASIPLDKTTSDLVSQLKSALAGIVADRQEFEASCQSASLQDVQNAMGKLLNNIPKERTKPVKILARYAGAVDKFADMVAPIVSAGQPVAPIVFASIAVILKVIMYSAEPLIPLTRNEFSSMQLGKNSYKVRILSSFIQVSPTSYSFSDRGYFSPLRKGLAYPSTALVL